jgi:predicted RNase H-like HicB family nuclease
LDIFAAKAIESRICTIDKATNGGPFYSALRDHGADTGGETREEALIHIENVIAMILAETESRSVMSRSKVPNF